MRDGDYVVFTRLAPVREGGKIYIRTYGPYDFNKAQNIRDQLRRMATRNGQAGRADIGVCKLRLDFEEAESE